MTAIFTRRRLPVNSILNFLFLFFVNVNRESCSCRSTLENVVPCRCDKPGVSYGCDRSYCHRFSRRPGHIGVRQYYDLLPLLPKENLASGSSDPASTAAAVPRNYHSIATICRRHGVPTAVPRHCNVPAAGSRKRCSNARYAKNQSWTLCKPITLGWVVLIFHSDDDWIKNQDRTSAWANIAIRISKWSERNRSLLSFLLCCHQSLSLSLSGLLLSCWINLLSHFVESNDD